MKGVSIFRNQPGRNHEINVPDFTFDWMFFHLVDRGKKLLIITEK